ncbi:preprotein translocase subunit SecG [uncultured Rhodospira sp.]|uniref:preprotein translocase subunit SecG n=1 Tax=uncultured Rhodospira sp. TaxID=1936189 RepID=UPI0026381AEC|nr:preprotein translocase subunit SecG [uncultured Rhodospira sp.]
MITVILVIHLLIAIAMVALILLQRSEGGALGIGGGGGGGGGGGLMTGRAAGNLLTRSTGFLAAAFFATSMTLAILADSGQRAGSVLDAAPAEEETVPATPAIPGPEVPTGESTPEDAVPAVPAAPLSE